MANKQLLKDIRCPQCLNETAFVVQMTMNIILVDDGIDFGISQPEADHFPGRVIDPDDGLFDEDPIQCLEQRGGCGYRGTVDEFRVPELVTA